MLKRKAYGKLLAWKNSSSRRAMLVTGARQIGKTYLVRRFAEDNYESFIELNLLLDGDAKSIFSRARTAEDILARLSLVAGKRVTPGKTLVFLDEIQEAPEALTAIKGLIDKSEVDFVLSGSLLGVELRNIRSNPAGYVTTLKMHPLDFEEFCWANGVDEPLYDGLRDCLRSETPVDAVVNESMHDLFRKYLVVGGMPDAVQTFVSQGDLAAVRDVQEAVKEWYRADISKYCPEAERLKVREAFDLVPAELNNPNKRFVLKNLNENARFRTYEDAFLWLNHASVALAAYNVSEPTSPLLASKERNLFKLFYSDVGLLSSSYSRKASLDILDGSNEVNHGSTYENAVAQELVAHGFDLYYYNSKKYGEVDFVAEDRDGRVALLEVKSGKSYKRHRAISNVLGVENYRIAGAYVLGGGNIERQEKVLYLPIYMAALFENE